MFTGRTKYHSHERKGFYYHQSTSYGDRNLLSHNLKNWKFSQTLNGLITMIGSSMKQQTLKQDNTTARA